MRYGAGTDGTHVSGSGTPETNGKPINHVDGLPKFKSLVALQENAALGYIGYVIYAHDVDGLLPTRLSYRDLLSSARKKANLIRSMPRVSKDTIVLLHFDNHTENNKWFWAVVLADLPPAISTTLSADSEQRIHHLNHLRHLLHDPIILTNENLID